MKLYKINALRCVLATGVCQLAIAGGGIALLAPSAALAQQSTASLRGTLTLPAGQKLEKIEAVEIKTGFRSAATIEGNEYNIPSVRPGTYQLEITTNAGTRRTDDITLAVGQSGQLDIDLGSATLPGKPIDASSNDIIVTAGRVKSLQGGEVGVTISRRLIEQLPQNNRNFLAFADLAPGVQFITDASGNSRIQGGAQSSRSVNVFIDGVGQKDLVLKNGVAGQDSSQGNPFPQLAVGEYRVLSSNYKAEFDQVSSVAITAVTRSGTNEFHGEGFVDFTNAGLRAKTPIEKTTNAAKVKTKDFQFGAAFGGPIVKDLAHFFVTYEGKRQQVPVDIQPATSLNTKNIPAAFGGEFGSFNRTFNEDLYFGKIDIAPTAADLIELSGKIRRESAAGISSGSSLRSTGIDSKTREDRVTLRWEHRGEGWINDLKLTYENVNWAPTPQFFDNGRLFYDSAAALIFRDGGGANYQSKGQKGYALQNDVTFTSLPGHTIKIGIKAKLAQLRTLSLTNTNASFYYNTQYNGATWNDVTPYRMVFGFDSGLGGDPQVKSDNFQLGLYAQDDWDITDRLTLNAGLRWDFDRTPAYLNYQTPASVLTAISAAKYPNLVNADYNINDYISTGKERKTFKGAFQPRIGFSYKLDAQGQFTLFGGYGRSYDRTQFDFIQTEISTGSYTTRTINFLVPGDTRNNCTASATCVAWDPKYLTAAGRASLINAIGPLGGAEIRMLNNNLKVPYADQFSLGLRSRFKLLELELGYNRVQSRDGFLTLLGNRRPDGSFFAPGTTEGAPFTATPPGRGSLILGTNGLDQNSDSVYFKLVKDYAKSSPWSVNLTYTFTAASENRAFGESSSFDYPSIDDYPVLASTGVSKHRIVAAGNVDLPLDFVFSSRITLVSPPYIIGRGYPGDVTGNRVLRVIEADNKRSFILGDLWAKRQVDIALTKNVKLPFLLSGAQVRVRADVLNVFNTANYTSYNGTGTSTAFGTISSQAIGGNPPRTFKLTAGYSF